MRLVRRLLGFGLLAASVLFVRGRRRAARALNNPVGADELHFDDSIGTSVPANENLVDVATQSGIADVDPEPLSHVAGEGIDPDGDLKAHTELRDLRDRLPR
jgi:hypothetical protein